MTDEESDEGSTMNAIRKVRFWLKKIVCAINKQNCTGILCRTQTLINKKNLVDKVKTNGSGFIYLVRKVIWT